FCHEAEVLSKAFYDPARPVVLVLGGRKKGKLEAAQMLLGWADSILLGGQLVELTEANNLAQHKKVVADLTKKGEDITLDSARQFGEIIKKAGTVIWSGPMGAFEDARYIKGTRVVAEALVSSKAFAVVGGGDTEAALTKLGLTQRIDFICSGGGAMLFFFALRGNLPAIKVVLEKK
ncbi:phosphoglycerate kinase, partial [Patescibacteria group bacterium]|nr:phosphoglycerate kinase [Patescibacteria group bacterium]